jgi:hypothetical protein
MVLITRYFEGHFAKDVKKIFAVFLICCAPVVGLFHFLAFDMYHKVFVLFRLPVAFLLLGYFLTSLSVIALVVLFVGTLILPVWIGWPILLVSFIYTVAV